MVVTNTFIEQTYPLHKLVWENKTKELEASLAAADSKVLEQIEQLDPRGRTPLMLAVVLGHADIASVLLKNNASAQFEHKSGWNVLHEATCRGDPELLKLILEYKDAQKLNKRSSMIPDLLRRLADAPDFYVEIKFELSSWMPFVGSVVPGNFHRIYKMGSKVRIDSVVLDDETVDWSKGVTLIFQGLEDSVRMIEIYHSTHQAFSNVILSGTQRQTVVSDSRTYEKSISHRLSNPAMIAYVDLDKIEFERNKTVWGWGSDKSEVINNYDCKVFSASNVEFVTKLRTEHLSESDKNEATSKDQTKSNLHRILHSFGTTETSEHTLGASASSDGAGSSSQTEITSVQYFDKDFDLRGRDIGRSKETRTKINKFKAHVWLSEEYPVNFQEQIMPIIDIMALTNTMFSKLKQFIQMQIPAGFPVKIEIPLFHVVNGRVTFHNIFAKEEEVQGVSRIEEDNGRVSCVLEDELFEAPPQYQIRKVPHPTPINSSDDDLFSWTVPDDESEAGRSKMVDIYEALNAPRTLTMKDVTPDSDTEEQLLQRAIEESLIMARMKEDPNWTPSAQSSERGMETSDQEGLAAGSIARTSSFDELQAAIYLSRRQVEEDDRLREEEEEALRRVLELSLKEK